MFKELRKQAITLRTVSIFLASIRDVDCYDEMLVDFEHWVDLIASHKQSNVTHSRKKERNKVNNETKIPKTSLHSYHWFLGTDSMLNSSALIYVWFIREVVHKQMMYKRLLNIIFHSFKSIDWAKKNCLFIGENSEYRAHKNYPQHSEGFYQKVYLLLASVYAITIFSSYVLCFPIMACISEWKSVQLNAKNSELWVKKISTNIK